MEEPLLEDSAAFAYLWEIEKSFAYNATVKRAQELWHLTIYASLLYVLLLLALQRYMRNRPPFKLQTALIAWNLFQALLSIVATYRGGTEYVVVAMREGFVRCLCDRSLWTKLGGFWGILYAWGKLVDFGDSFFIVLRKRPLTYLHVIHHTFTFIFAWYFIADEFAFGAFLVTVNAFIHCIMYSYYTVKALRFHVPEWVSMCLTILQMAQLACDFMFPLLIVGILSSGQKCDNSYLSLTICGALSGLYFMLFANFFYVTYFGKKKLKAIPKFNTNNSKHD